MQVVRSVGHFKAVNCLRVPLVERKPSISIMGSGPLASLEVIHCAKLMESEISTSARTRLATIARHMSPSNCCSTSYLCGIQGSLETQHGGIRIEGRVRDALMAGKPVVALESTIISHGGMGAVYIIDCFQGPRVVFHLVTKLCTRVYGQGMPYPQNFQVAKEVESIVQQSGVTPATIAIIDGIPCIGLMEHELEKLAQLGPQCVKTSRRNIAYVMAKKLTGATTVSGTMFLASKVGIHVFVTGGIGGVHRHGETTMDVSADLTELGRTAVTVVCAGVKSILDIPRTLEYLETQGVTVIGYGTDEFPAFFTPQSGCQVRI
ncbi:hypothetical protein BDL97_04G086600 [Sphagnum fallax]|nr:hypothetical protein BDL97_04G086600 [Sphagnum fallax]